MASSPDHGRGQAGQAKKGSSARQPTKSDTFQHRASRVGQRTGTTRLQVCPLCRRLQHLLQKKSEARKIGNAVFLFLKNKLKLPINREKSGIRRPVNFKLLGYKFVPTYEKGTKGKYQLVVSEDGWKELKEKIRIVTRKTAPLSLAERTRQLKEIGRGWVNYFRLASLVGKLGTIDSWVRNRLRYCIWSR